MEENEDEPEDVRKATPVEDDIKDGSKDDTAKGPQEGKKKVQKASYCEKSSSKRTKADKKRLKSEADCCRAKEGKPLKLPKMMQVLVYSPPCAFPKLDIIPRHCLSKKEYIDVLAAPSRKCPPPCLGKTVIRKVRPLSSRLKEISQPTRHRILATLEERGESLPPPMVDNLLKTLEGETCMTPEQAEQYFRDKERCGAKKSGRNPYKTKCKPKQKKPCPSFLDKEAVTCQYLMAERFVRSILQWKCPIPKEEFKDIAEVILRRLSYILEYTPMVGQDRKSQQMRFLADIIACWIAGVLFEVAEEHRKELEEELEKKRLEKEQESEEEDEEEEEAKSVDVIEEEEEEEEEEEDIEPEEEIEKVEEEAPKTPSEEEVEKVEEQAEKEDTEAEEKETTDKEAEEKEKGDKEKEYADTLKEEEEEKRKEEEEEEKRKEEEEKGKEEEEEKRRKEVEEEEKRKEQEEKRKEEEEETRKEEERVKEEEEKKRKEEEEERIEEEGKEAAAKESELQEGEQALEPTEEEKDKEAKDEAAEEMIEKAEEEEAEKKKLEEKEEKESEEKERKEREAEEKRRKSEEDKLKAGPAAAIAGVGDGEMFKTDLPFVTFGKILELVYNMLEKEKEGDEEDPIHNRIQRAIYKKFTNLVIAENPQLLTKPLDSIIDVVSGKLATWLKDVLSDSQITFMEKNAEEVESVEIRNWTKWIDSVADRANDWANWIHKTVKDANDKATEKVNRGDWHDWTTSVATNALLWRRFHLEAVHEAHHNKMMMASVNVVHTGQKGKGGRTRDDTEKLVKTTDLTARSKTEADKDEE